MTRSSHWSSCRTHALVRVFATHGAFQAFVPAQEPAAWLAAKQAMISRLSRTQVLYGFERARYMCCNLKVAPLRRQIIRVKWIGSESAPDGKATVKHSLLSNGRSPAHCRVTRSKCPGSAKADDLSSPWTDLKPTTFVDRKWSGYLLLSRSAHRTSLLRGRRKENS